jgi:hypothetical protein
MSLVEAQCSQFTSDEMSQYSRKALLSGNADDPLLRQALSLSGKPSSEARAAALAEIFAAADPLVLDELGLRLAITAVDGRSAFQFDGTIWGVNDPSPLPAALYLVPCEFGLPCSETDPLLALGCVTGGPCFGSREERVKVEMSAGDKARFDEVLQLRDRIVVAIRRGEVYRFVHN